MTNITCRTLVELERSIAGVIVRVRMRRDVTDIIRVRSASSITLYRGGASARTATHFAECIELISCTARLIMQRIILANASGNFSIVSAKSAL